MRCDRDPPLVFPRYPWRGSKGPSLSVEGSVPKECGSGRKGSSPLKGEVPEETRLQVFTPVVLLRVKSEEESICPSMGPHFWGVDVRGFPRDPE